MPHPDQKYIEALRSNDNILIDEIYQNCYPDIEKFVLKNSGTIDQAKNIFQEALIALWEKVKTKKVELTVPFCAYFYSICRFKWLNFLNRDKVRNNTNSAVEISDVEKYVDSVIDYFAEGEESMNERRFIVFTECFKYLSEDCQRMFKLKFEGKKAKEIAEITGRASSNAVFVAMLSCRKKLKTFIETHQDFNTLGFA